MGAFGNLINCFTFLTGFDDGFHERLGVNPILPEDLGWLDLATKEDWIASVRRYFNPHLPAPPCTAAVCFPMIRGALDYHCTRKNRRIQSKVIRFF